jgi:hypothetical protein
MQLGRPILTKAPLLICLLAQSSCLDPCGDTERSASWSPDRAHVIRVVERDCGVFSSVVTRIEMHAPVLGLPVGAPKTLLFSAKYQQKVDVKWLNNQEATIECQTCTPAPARKETWKGIKVSLISGP